jgi:hypothetical protein
MVKAGHCFDGKGGLWPAYSTKADLEWERRRSERPENSSEHEDEKRSTIR